MKTTVTPHSMEKGKTSNAVVLKIITGLLFFLMSGCQGNGPLTSKTLILNVSADKGSWKVESYSNIKRPYYHSSANVPIYQGDMLDSSGKVLKSEFFGKEYIKGDGKVYQLPFPSLDKAKTIIIYRLDSSSGHITNKNEDKILEWEIPSLK